MVALSSVKVGDTLWDKRRVKMGNTTLTKIAVYPVVVEEVHDTYIVACWNGNRADRMYASTVAKLFRNKPVVK